MATAKTTKPKTSTPRAKAPAKPAAAAKTASARTRTAKPKTAAKPKATAPKAAPAVTAKAPSATSRALGIASVGALAVAIGAALFEGIRRLTRTGNAEHAAPDLALDQPRPSANDRAPEAFRPDPTAPVPASEREGLRPATGQAPSLAVNNARDFALAD